MTKAGVIIPLYIYPGRDWTILVQAKITHPAVPFVVIVNPSSGPGRSVDVNYLSGVRMLQSANMYVLGYIFTDYARKNVAGLAGEIDDYASFYHLDGIFFDGMTSAPGKEEYYSYLSGRARSHGMRLTIGNPGTDTVPSYVGTVDALVIFEAAGLPSGSYLREGWHSSYGRDRLAFISHSVARLPQSFDDLTGCVGFVYATDGRLPNPYGSLPTYLQDLVANLDQPR